MTSRRLLPPEVVFAAGEVDAALVEVGAEVVDDLLLLRPSPPCQSQAEAAVEE